MRSGAMFHPSLLLAVLQRPAEGLLIVWTPGSGWPCSCPPTAPGHASLEDGHSCSQCRSCLCGESSFSVYPRFSSSPFRIHSIHSMALYHTVPVLSCGSNDQSADRSSGGHVIIGFIYFLIWGPGRQVCFSQAVEMLGEARMPTLAGWEMGRQWAEGVLVSGKGLCMLCLPWTQTCSCSSVRYPEGVFGKSIWFWHL